MPDLHDEIAELEAEIDGLSGAAERCRKITLAAKAVITAGGLLLLIILTGLIQFGPAALVAAITAVLGGITLFGLNQSTRDQIIAQIKAHEARRAELIDGVELQSVGET